MAQKTGKSIKFYFNTLDLTNSLATEVRLRGAADEIDASTINSQGFKSYLQGPYELTFDVTGVWDDGTATTGIDQVMRTNLQGGGTKLWDYYPGGSAASQEFYRGNGFLTAWEVGGAVDGLVGFSATVRNSGSVTMGTI